MIVYYYCIKVSARNNNNISCKKRNTHMPHIKNVVNNRNIVYTMKGDIELNLTLQKLTTQDYHRSFIST